MSLRRLYARDVFALTDSWPTDGSMRGHRHRLHGSAVIVVAVATALSAATNNNAVAAPSDLYTDTDTNTDVIIDNNDTDSTL